MFVVIFMASWLLLIAVFIKGRHDVEKNKYFCTFLWQGDEAVLGAGPKPMLTEIAIHHV